MFPDARRPTGAGTYEIVLTLVFWVAAALRHLDTTALLVVGSFTTRGVVAG